MNWRDTSLSPEERARALLAEMTLEEKIAQLCGAWPGYEDTSGDVAPMQEVFSRASVPFEQARAHGLGHLTRVFGTAPVSSAEGAARVAELQKEVTKNTRLGVPAIVHEECLTGFTTYGATVYPTSLAWGATFDPELVERMAAAIGEDMRKSGVHQALSPVLDVVRDYRWGRVEETIGEDPYLVGQLGSAYVRGLENAGIIATLKHFAGYSASRAARNHAPVSIGPRELYDVILPPFEMAIREGGARSVMAAYVDLDGVPASAHQQLLTKILREEWGFDGVVVSDYWSIPFLMTMHKVADNLGRAGALALSAGVDVELPNSICYGEDLANLVRSGEFDESLLDRSVLRLLRQKAELGLLDEDWAPDGSEIDMDSPRNRAIAKEMAEKSVVLLANDGTLPVRAGKIAVVGPCADDPLTFLGCYSFPNHNLARFPELGLGLEVPSLLESLRAELPDAEITFHTGCPIRDEDRSGFAEAAAAARDADLCIAVVGDHAGMFGHGTSGEGCDAADLSLPGVQDELVAELLATGTPVVVVVVSGRPYALGPYADTAAALVQAFMPGVEGGQALAGVLSGRVVPSGKLPVQVPRLAGGSPGTYLHPPLGGNSEGISNLDPTPLFPFGHGISYTRFEYSNLTLSATEIPTDGELSVSVEVGNVGERAGEEVVQLYLRDVQGQVTRPVLQLTGFARVALAPGERKRVTFALHADRTGFTGLDLRRIVEPGTIEVFAGPSAGDLPCSASFELTGEVRVLNHDRVLSTPATVEPVS